MAGAEPCAPKEALIDLLAVITTVKGLVLPLASPPHPLNCCPEAGLAVRVTLVPEA